MILDSRVHALQRLSDEAIRYAYELDVAEVGELTGRLYFFNRIPVSNRWRSRFSTPDEIADFLGLENDPPEGIEPVRSGTDEPRFWHSWRVRGSPKIDRAKQPTHKVYFSPLPDVCPAVVEALLRNLPDSGASMAKCPLSTEALLRPDKIVAYFGERDAAVAFARTLAEDLSELPAQGVPFSEPCDPNGLVSLSADPPTELAATEPERRESGRVWVVSRIAETVLEAREAAAEDPVAFVREAVSRRGIDSATWLPEYST